MTEIYFTLLIAGVMLIGAEVFVPGGVLGVLGGILLFVAALLGFVVFPPEWAAFALLAMILLLGLAIVLWIRFFPSTPVGRNMTISSDLKSAHAANETLASLVGLQGSTLSALRPSGFAEINGRRIDVISQSDMIPEGETIEVMRVEGNRVLVDRPQEPPANQGSPPAPPAESDG